MACTPAQPVINEVCENTWNQQQLEGLRDRVRNARVSINDRPPPVYPHLYEQLNTRQLYEDRCAKIEYENRLLLKKMGEIMSKPPVYSTTEHRPRSLNAGSRRRDLVRIMNENQGILKRMQEDSYRSNRKSLLAQWKRHANEHEAYRKNIRHKKKAVIPKFRSKTPRISLVARQANGGMSVRKNNVSVQQRVGAQTARQQFRASTSQEGRRPRRHEQLDPFPPSKPKTPRRLQAPKPPPPSTKLSPPKKFAAPTPPPKKEESNAVQKAIELARQEALDAILAEISSVAEAEPKSEPQPEPEPEPEPDYKDDSEPDYEDDSEPAPSTPAPAPAPAPQPATAPKAVPEPVLEPEPEPEPDYDEDYSDEPASPTTADPAPAPAPAPASAPAPEEPKPAEPPKVDDTAEDDYGDDDYDDAFD